MPLDAMLFDLDGTLLDTNPTHAEAWVRGLGRHGFRFTVDRVGPEIGKGGDLLVPSLLGTDIDREFGDAIRASVSEAFREIASTRPLNVFPGAAELLGELQSRGVRLALATSAGENELSLMLEQANVDLRPFFDVVISKADVAHSKPEPDVVLAAVQKLGLSSAQCAMVGDTPFDATSARRAGVVTLGVRSNGLLDDETLEQRMRVAGARHVWRNTAHLLNELDFALRIAAPLAITLTVGKQRELMLQALQVAEEGMSHGEAPIGCVLADMHGRIIARGYNEFNATGNRTAHAEMVAFARAASDREVHDNLLLVSTLEPCVMCTGASMLASVDTILFGLRAPADNGSQRVTPPESPDGRMPRIVGDILASESRALFERWLASGPSEEQARYGRQLLAIT